MSSHHNDSAFRLQWQLEEMAKMRTNEARLSFLQQLLHLGLVDENSERVLRNIPPIPEPWGKSVTETLAQQHDTDLGPTREAIKLIAQGWESNVCECGAEKTGTFHSPWCPKSSR